MVEVARSTEPSGILQKDIAKNQHISLKYLDPIILDLKQKGLIVNSGGRGSGYIITRPAEEITMLDIYTAFEQIIVIECINNPTYCDRTVNNCKGRSYWHEFRNDFCEILERKNLAEIVKETYYECKDIETVTQENT